MARTCYVCRVFTLGSAQESWRTVKTNLLHRPTSDSSYGRCIEGVIYYLASGVLVSFDVRSEKFDMLGLPADFRGDMLITYKGRLALFSRIDNRINDKRLWVLEDAQKQLWSGQDLSPFCDFDQIWRYPFRLTGFTHAGEFIYAPQIVSHSFYILLCDPVRNSWRRFEFKGLANEASVHNGVEEEKEYVLHAFPNHIVSQMSLTQPVSGFLFP